MKPSRLVLTKWQGDVISAHTVPADSASEGGASGATPVGGEENGVSVETIDIRENRRTMGLGPAFDVMSVLGIVSSLGVHGVVGTAVLVAAIIGASNERSREESANEQAAMLRDMTARIEQNAAENEGDQDQEKRQLEEQRKAREGRSDKSGNAGIGEGAPIDPNAPMPGTAQKGKEETAAETPELTPPKGAVEGPADKKKKREPRMAAATSNTGEGTGDSGATASKAVCAPPVVSPNTGPTCTKTVTITSLDTQPFCYVDTIVKRGQSGTLTYPCDGDGEVTLAFDGKSFVGATKGGKLEACTGTQYPFSDGCTWNSAQKVSGSIASGHLSFAYGEAPKAGQQACAKACTANGTVQISGSVTL